MENLKCPGCSSSEIRKGGFITLNDGNKVQRYVCKNPDCRKSFLPTYIRNREQPSGITCTRCGSTEIKNAGYLNRLDGSKTRRYLCQESGCNKSFLADYKPSNLPSDIICPRCGSSEIKKGGFVEYADGRVLQCYRCKKPDCDKVFTIESRVLHTALPANTICPKCSSANTIQVGKPLKWKNYSSQPCRCKDCEQRFTIGKREKLQFFAKDKLIYSCWYPPGPKYAATVVCPECSQKKAILKTELKRGPEKGKKIYVCLECGRSFSGQWRNNVFSLVGQDIPRISWNFEEDLWDMREIYPNIEPHRLRQFFLNFSNYQSLWFKELVKAYLVHIIQTGSSHTHTASIFSLISQFERFLHKQSIASIEAIDRQLVQIYWIQEQGHLARKTLSRQMNVLRKFFEWGNAEKYFTTSPTLITRFDKPKVFHSEANPLEDNVLKAIRDNLSVLPQPLQLMFMLGFWLGTRPSELCFLSKNCISLDPDGSTWQIEFKRSKPGDSHRLPITTDLVQIIQQQQNYITRLHGEDYPYLFCHYQGFKQADYPKYANLKAINRPPTVASAENPMVKAIRHLIEECDIRDSNGELAKFTGQILRPSRATQLIKDGFSLDFVRIWLKHCSATTTKRHYTRYPPGELLDVACVMANFDQKYIPYDTKPDSLRQSLDLHELDGLKMPYGEPLYGYCTFRDFCPRFGRCYTCGFHIASIDKLAHYKTQLEQLRVKKSEVFNYGSSELLNSYTEIVNALEDIVAALETVV